MLIPQALQHTITNQLLEPLRTNSVLAPAIYQLEASVQCGGTID